MSRLLQDSKNFGPKVSTITKLVAEAKSLLSSANYLPENTLTASTLCRDELNQRAIDQLVTSWGPIFNLSGLAGIPSAGNTAFAAFSHHVEREKGKLLIIHGPHIGQSADGVWGEVKRDRMGSSSTACGSLCLALKQIAGELPPPSTANSYGGPESDWEQWVVYQSLYDQLQANKLDRALSITEATSLMSQIIHLQVEQRRRQAIPNECKVAILGGVWINTPHLNDDFFAPHYFSAEVEGEEQKINLLDQLNSSL
ncbi:MAG: hypothetical protein HN353_01040 [Bdellovibrionales bacterium]|jgi:hypothetical protein|nr:hypothetical protein [Bdellovibrionales bacterium]MBT3526745.1 hypothetical protein [Bdellovibrionales bacterium]MBT7767111.1 hypothetical protein [Bdellovibrionales bacterium]